MHAWMHGCDLVVEVTIMMIIMMVMTMMMMMKMKMMVMMNMVRWRRRIVFAMQCHAMPCYAR